jgi:FlaA1/EpsC-like NDP-sugar epimerase
MLDGKRVLVTGGTGSLGQVLVRRLLAGTAGTPNKVVVLSRDEAKQHLMRLSFSQRTASTDEVIYENFTRRLQFRIGDVRQYADVCAALRDVDVVVNAAALKQVPTCEYFPSQAVATNVGGAENIVRAIRDLQFPVETVVGVSTDKACKPVNVMGMTKAVMERVFVAGALEAPATRWLVVRYGNVLASRGSVIPLFLDQIRRGGPITITSPHMTRFLITLEDAVDTILAAIDGGRTGETYVPVCPSATVPDVAAALVGNRCVETVVTGIRPGEKLHEILISEEEARHVERRGHYYAIGPMLPEIASVPLAPSDVPLAGEYSSRNATISPASVRGLLEANELLVEQQDRAVDAELLR